MMDSHPSLKLYDGSKKNYNDYHARFKFCRAEPVWRNGQDRHTIVPMYISVKFPESRGDAGGLLNGSKNTQQKLTFRRTRRRQRLR